jgi:hypothetical protein
MPALSCSPDLCCLSRPSNKGGSVVFESTFYLMDLRRGGSVVLLENIGSGVFFEGKDEIDFFRRRGSMLAQAGLNPAESANFVGNIRKEYERQ